MPTTSRTCFFIIRDKTMDVVPQADRPALFDLLFQSIDFFRGEIEKVENDEPLDKNIDTFLSNINTLMAKIKGEAPPEAPLRRRRLPPPAAHACTAGGGRQPGFPYELHVYF